MTKTELRQQFLARRKALTSGEVIRQSQSIAEHFFAHLAKTHLPDTPSLIHTFLPIKRYNEVDTWPIIQSLWQQFPSIQVAVSVTDARTHSLTHYPLNAHTNLVDNQWGVPEPVHTGQSAIGSQQIDLVLVPLLAFDQGGHRVGYGGGYYDRFLAECRPDCLKTGLSLFDPVEPIDTVDLTDVRLTMCITPKQTYFFN